MEGAATAVEALAQNLIKEEYHLIKDLDKAAKQLQMTLGMIQGYLNDAEKKSIKNEAVKIWLRELEAVAFKADNVLDELDYHLLQKTVNKMKTLMDKVLSCFSFCNLFVSRRNVALTIKKIDADFEYMNKRATELGLQSILVNALAASHAVPETDSQTLDPIFIGRDDDVPKLVEKLITETSQEERIFSILSILGMGGMGKTTLTRKVFNHQKMKARFGSLIIWVHVSETFDPIILFNKILSILTSQTIDGVATREVILKNLKEALKEKTYLLVLDDVWNGDVQKWDDFKDSISGVTSTKGNAIIITTRKDNVASIVRPFHIHPLNGLLDEDCWSIIKAKAFENGDVPSAEFEMIGKKIAKRCQGLPLAANVVGGVLRCKSEQEWHSINDNWLTEDEGDKNISKILKLSFDHLPSPSLKKCFAYCSIFPKGEEMEKQQLIELWMAEGFLQSDERNEMESVGSKFLNVLVQNSLLLVAERDDDGNVESCVMHDLVHDLASSVSGCSNNADGSSTPVRYMKTSSAIPKEVAKHLRTLFAEGEISGNMFSDLECLHNLTLMSYGVRELPYSIRELIHLRNLSISKTSIKNLPKWIGELHHLQTLRADTMHLKKLPSSLKYLINLRHLYTNDGVELPAEIGRLTSLQTLKHFRVGDNKGYRIEELGGLKKLKGKLVIHNLEKVHDKEEAEKANMFLKSNLLHLRFKWDGCREGEINDESVLERLQPHANLKKLGIRGFEGKRFPLWIQQLNNLIEIKLSECHECEEIPTLEHLPNLKYLYLRGLKKVGRFTNYSFNNNQNLSKLEISTCPKLSKLPDGLDTLTSLEELTISECPNLKSMGNPSGGGGQYKGKLRSVSMEILERLECLPDWLFYNNQNLSKLEIDECPKLSKLPDGLDTLTSLEELTISDCPNLKSMGNPSGGGGQSQGILHMLCIEECEELMELPRQMLESWAPSLEELSLQRLSSLKNLPMVIHCLAKSASLRELRIVSVPKLLASCSVESWDLGSLLVLIIDASVEWSRESSVGINKTVDGILQGCCNSLNRLELRGMENWDWMPESMQHLTALDWLKLENIGVEELPQWFGKLSSLSILFICNFTRLRCLNALERLTELRHLFIYDCPELSINSEWRKTVPHLSIWVGGRPLD